jgi:uncharacterized protein (DUF983 family)
VNRSEQQAAPGTPVVRRRTTDSPLTTPSAARAFLALTGLVRLRCPHCRRGKVIRGWYRIHERCSTCTFRYERSDENYFQGAMFVNFMIGGFTFAASFLAVLVLSWPNVPWNALTYGAPVVMLLFMVLLYPISKVVWLTVDVMLRPVMPDELQVNQTTARVAHPRS